MTSRAVSRRYARALLMLAAERDAIEQYEKELGIFRQILIEEPNLKRIMDNPRILPQDKKTILKKMIQDRVSPVVSNFLCLIVDKKREGLFLEIIKEYHAYADQAGNIVNAEVRSVVRLADKDFRELEERLSKATGKKVRLVNTIDTSLIGGFIVRIGDTVIDGSVAKKLALLKKRLQQPQL